MQKEKVDNEAIYGRLVLKCLAEKHLVDKEDLPILCQKCERIIGVLDYLNNL